MRADRDNRLTAEIVLNQYEESELFTIFQKFGEFEKPSRLAREILLARPLKTTGDLRRIVEAIVSPKALVSALSKVFQAVRIEVNDELSQLETALSNTLEVLRPHGRMVVISYHSLEDRIVKHFFQKEATDCICPPKLPVCRCGHKARLLIITKKAEKAGLDEVSSNPSSRSAILRVAEKIS